MFNTLVTNTKCHKCQFAFNGISKGAFLSHVRLCSAVGTTLTLHEPIIPSHMTEVYHGDVSEMRCDDREYSNGPDPYELRILLQNATPGEQEAVFEDVVMQIENDDYHVPEQRYESYAYGRFQEKISRRGSSYNPLGFRGDIDENEMLLLHNTLLFIRQYDLSVAAGNICMKYMYNIHVYYTCILLHYTSI